MGDHTMSKRERRHLAKLIRRREKLAKADVDRLRAEQLAKFEAQAAAEDVAKERIPELRRVAKTWIDAAGKTAKAALEAQSVEAEKRLIAAGVEFEVAREYVATLHPAEALMPAAPPSVAEIEQASTQQRAH